MIPEAATAIESEAAEGLGGTMFAAAIRAASSWSKASNFAAASKDEVKSFFTSADIRAVSSRARIMNRSNSV
jgi:hypothetical protein